jgi:hypothetical protein
MASWTPSIVSAIVASLSTAALIPTVQHLYWRRQKLREQKLVLAERFGNLLPRIVLLFQPGPSEESINQLMGEIDAVLFVSQVLFKKQTKVACFNAHVLLKLQEWGDQNGRITPATRGDFQKAYEAFADALGPRFR